MVLAAVPVIVAVSISAVVAIGLLIPGSIHISTGEGQFSYNVSGMVLNVSGTCEIDSELPYDVDDLSVTVLLLGEGVDDVTIWSTHGVRIPSGDTVTLDVTATVYYPALYLLIMEKIDQDSSVFDFRIYAECRYMADLIDIRVQADFSYSISADGGVPEIDRYRPSETEAVVVVENLNPSLMPQERHLAFSSAVEWLELSVETDGRLVIDITASGNLEDVLRDLGGSADQGGVTVTDENGEPADMSTSDIDNLLTVLTLIVEGGS